MENVEVNIASYNNADPPRPLDEGLHKEAVAALDRLIEATIRSSRIDRHAMIRDLCEIARDLLAANAAGATEFDALDEGPQGFNGMPGIMGCPPPEPPRRRRRAAALRNGVVPAPGGIPMGPYNDGMDMQRQLQMQIAELGPALVRQQDRNAGKAAAAEIEHLSVARRELVQAEAPKDMVASLDRRIEAALAKTEAEQLVKDALAAPPPTAEDYLAKVDAEHQGLRWPPGVAPPADEPPR